MRAWRGLAELARDGADAALPGAEGLNAAAAAWRSALRAAGHRRVGLHAPDAGALQAALLGAWGAGCTVWLSGDDSPDSARNLRPHVDVLLGSFGGDAWAAPPAAAPAAPAAFPERPVVVFTSGSGGEPVACGKSTADLENELRGLEAAFGAELGPDALVAGTVGHQHIYGLLFRVLWPLCAGRASRAEILRYPEELEALARAHGRVALVSSPAFLKRLPGAPLAAGPAVVFSSGGPLDFDAAAQCRRVLGCEPLEIYGSSETGGVAWRRRRAEAQAWTPFAGVELRVDAASGLLEIRSDRVDGARAWLRSADRARVEGGGFTLLGRADRVAKVEEKRVSLGALERALEAEAPVREARVLALRGRRDELGAVLTLRDGSVPEGPAKAALVADLKRALRRGFEAVVLPRRWRIVAALPLNATGKVVQADLLRLFDPPRAPQWLGEEPLAEGGVRLRLRLPADLAWFEGHFPGAPVLPGVVQLHWAVEEGRRRLGLDGAFAGLRQLKFMRPLLPGDEAVLELRPDAVGLRFSYESALGRHSSGRVELGPARGR